MRKSKDVLDQVTQTLQTKNHQLSTDSQTEAGQTVSNPDSKQKTGSNYTPDHIDAINQMFTEFELAYHNQYHKAFPNDQSLNLAKQLWLRNLAEYSPERILMGVRRVISRSEYLPTISSLIKHCEPQLRDFNLPEPREAYYEACRAPAPKAEHHWSHPAVYFAGRETDWFFIASSPEAKAFPVFERNYQIICERVMRGEKVDIELPKAIPEKISTPLTQEEKKERMKALREEVGL